MRPSFSSVGVAAWTLIVCYRIPVVCWGFIPPLTLPHSKGPSISVVNHKTLSKAFLSTRHTRLQMSTKAFDSSVMPRISSSDLEKLATKGFVVMENFLPLDLQEALRSDVQHLRSQDKFKIAKIGQDSTNALNQDIRVAETCFIGPSKLKDAPSEARAQLYKVLDQVRDDLSQNPILQREGTVTQTIPALDASLSEMLYAYYPSGGFYRRHRDAIPGSASVLRSYSLLLYLNKDWSKDDAGELRMHFDGGGDFRPQDAEPDSFVDVPPMGGTLVLFKSDLVPHEVLDTKSERVAVVGWYNRAVSASDIANLGSGGDTTQVMMLAVAAALVTVGVVSLVT